MGFILINTVLVAHICRTKTLFRRKLSCDRKHSNSVYILNPGLDLSFFIFLLYLRLLEFLHCDLELQALKQTEAINMLERNNADLTFILYIITIQSIRQTLFHFLTSGLN